MSEIKDHGEPWEHDNGDVFNEDGKFVYSKVTGFVTKDDVSRAVACVNALANRAPDKLEALEEAVSGVLDKGDLGREHECSIESFWRIEGKELEALQAALRAFRGEGE